MNLCPPYWDTSAAVKLYIPEPDSAFFLRTVGEFDGPFLSSKLIVVELLSAFYRKERAGNIEPGGALRAFRRFTSDRQTGKAVTLDISEHVLNRAEDIIRGQLQKPRSIMIRSLDAIQVASALTVGSDFMVSTDSRLREVAASAGLHLIP